VKKRGMTSVVLKEDPISNRFSRASVQEGRRKNRRGGRACEVGNSLPPEEGGKTTGVGCERGENSADHREKSPAIREVVFVSTGRTEAAPDGVS